MDAEILDVCQKSSEFWSFYDKFDRHRDSGRISRACVSPIVRVLVKPPVGNRPVAPQGGINPPARAWTQSPTLPSRGERTRQADFRCASYARSPMLLEFGRFFKSHRIAAGRSAYQRQRRSRPAMRLHEKQTKEKIFVSLAREANKHERERVRRKIISR